MFALGSGWQRGGRAIPVCLSPPADGGSPPGSGGQPRGVGSQPANTQLRETDLKMSPQFLCGKAEPPKDKTAKQGTPTRDHCL